MIFSTLRAPGMKKEGITRFLGYQPREDTCGENAFWEMTNGCGDRFPALHTRPVRTQAIKLSAPRGLTANGRLCWVDGQTLYYNGKNVGTVEEGEKRFVNMGAWILIFPDKVRFSIRDETLTPLEAEFVTTGDTLVTLCAESGEEYSYTASDTAPDAPVSGEVWLDTSGEEDVLKVYSGDSGLWSAMTGTFLRLESPGIGVNFAVYDGITLQNAGAFDGSYILRGKTDNSLILSGLTEQSETLPPGVRVSRRLPSMDFVCEYGNRLWGCSNEEHAIYASRLGDPTNFYAFEGISTDSYALTVGTPGDFTGCAAFGSSVVFFKEDALHRIYGMQPSQFQLVTSHAPGVKKGCEKSLALGSGTLYYKGPDGVYAYAGGQPVRMDPDFSGLPLQGARGIYAGGTYYLMGKEPGGACHLLRYEEERGQWYREDDSDVLDFAAMGGEMWFLRRDGALIRTGGGGSPTLLETDVLQEEGAVPFTFVTGKIGMKAADRKFYRRLQVRLRLAPGAVCRVALSRDGGAWEERLTLTGEDTVSRTLPVVPGRCDTCRLRFCGTGDVTLLGIYRIREGGSEL